MIFVEKPDECETFQTAKTRGQWDAVTQKFRVFIDYSLPEVLCWCAMPNE